MRDGAATRTLVLHPFLKSERNAARDPDSRLEEAVRLARAIWLDIIDARTVPLSGIKSATLMGSGKVEEIGEFITEAEITLVVVDGNVTPAQQRNLEESWKCKVIDRTALILEIFGARARTHEGKLQVELAALTYQKSRLVRSWTHLERQRGGFGFLGGPGESQIEIDRRLIRDRIAKLKGELEGVKRTRELHRKVRREVPYPVVALVGYTNAGKSTLFNRITGAEVMVADLLFATLDPTLRSVKLPSGLQIILSDTVGFVSDLPHGLVAAFRATLEEVVEADVILHVRDISHTDTEAQKQDVLGVLKELLPQESLTDNMIEVLNKIDLMPDDARAGIHNKDDNMQVAISAHSGEGVQTLLTTLETFLCDRFLATEEIELPVTDGKRLAWLHAHGSVVAQKPGEETMRLTVHMTHENLARFHKMGK